MYGPPCTGKTLLAKADIVLFPFPYSDLTNRKLCPCLVLSNKMNDDILLCQITSKEIPPDVYAIEIKKQDTLNGSLMIDSYIRSNMLFTTTKNQIQKKVCKIPIKKYKEVTNKINNLISASS